MKGSLPAAVIVDSQSRLGVRAVPKIILTPPRTATVFSPGYLVVGQANKSGIMGANEPKQSGVCGILDN